MYALNRWLLKPHLAVPFLRGQFNDLLLIACALPPMLLLHRKMGLRGHDRMPTLSEVGLHTAVWIVVCEVIGPRFWRGTGDYLDVLAYLAGALLATLCWHRSLLPEV